MSCTVCNHPERQAIDLALLNRTATLDQLSQQHQLSRSALHRHKQHLLKKITQTQDRFQDILRQGYLFTLYYFLELVMQVTAKASAEGNFRLLLQAARQATGIVKFMHKLDGSLDPHSVYRLLELSPGAEAGSLLPTDLKFFCASKQALADSLFASCPEPASDQDRAPGPGLGENAALADLADFNPAMLQNLLTDLTQSLGLAEFEAPPPRREKGGKKPKNDRRLNNNSMKYQYDSFCEKNAGKNPGCLGQPEFGSQNLLPENQNSKLDTPGWVQALDEGRLDINTLHAIGAGRSLPLADPIADFLLNTA
jgi:hypothetical protein